jgi:hypothetical protein
MHSRRLGVTVILASTLLLAGCLFGRSQGRDTGWDPSRREVTLYVTNLSFSEATIYGVTTGTRHVLGRVIGKKEAVFTMPLPFPTLMHLEIDLLAGPYCYTDRLTVDPGDELELIIQNDGGNWNCVAPGLRDRAQDPSHVPQPL